MITQAVLAPDKKKAEDVLHMIGQQIFATDDRVYEFVNSNLRKLNTSIDIPINKSESNALLWGTFEERTGRPIAGLLLYFYSWDKLRHQQYIQTYKSEGETCVICKSLQSIIEEEFEEEFNVTELQIAIEVGYLAILKENRGKGWGSKILEEAYHNILSQTTFQSPVLLFAIIMGKYASTGYGELLMNEWFKLQESQGNNSCTPLKSILDKLGFPSDLFAINDNSITSRVIAEKHELKFVGYNKNTGSVFAKII